jgi:multisubunit Na+/H+ antiporter MnhB subunit
MAFKDIEFAKIRGPVVRLGNVLYAAIILAVVLFLAASWSDDETLAMSKGFFRVGYGLSWTLVVVETTRRVLLYIASGISLLKPHVPTPGRFALAIAGLCFILAGFAFVIDGGADSPQAFDARKWERYRVDDLDSLTDPNQKILQ